MSLEIQVEQKDVKNLADQARQVPNERMEDAMNKLNDLQTELSSWKGKASPAHKEACTSLQEALESSQTLMMEILHTLDYAVDQFSDFDHAASAEFEYRVDHYLSK